MFLGYRKPLSVPRCRYDGSHSSPNDRPGNPFSPCLDKVHFVPPRHVLDGPLEVPTDLHPVVLSGTTVSLGPRVGLL